LLIQELLEMFLPLMVIHGYLKLLLQLLLVRMCKPLTHQELGIALLLEVWLRFKCGEVVVALAGVPLQLTVQVAAAVVTVL
jgi:hypothetical protein